jgi:hypothetical protein
MSVNAQQVVQVGPLHGSGPEIVYLRCVPTSPKRLRYSVGVNPTTFVRTSRESWPDSVASPVKFNFSASAVYPIRKMEVWIDGTKRRRDCLVLIHRCAQEQPRRRSWTGEEIDQVRELLIANPVETVASKIGRSTSSVRQLCGRLGIRVRELRCDLFSVNSLAAAMHVRKAEIRCWIEQGWLEAVRKDRNIRSATILAVFNQFCYVPKHTVGEQLLQVREAKREQAAYESATLFESGHR